MTWAMALTSGAASPNPPALSISRGRFRPQCGLRYTGGDEAPLLLPELRGLPRPDRAPPEGARVRDRGAPAPEGRAAEPRLPRAPPAGSGAGARGPRARRSAVARDPRVPRGGVSRDAAPASGATGG